MHASSYGAVSAFILSGWLQVASSSPATAEPVRIDLTGEVSSSTIVFLMPGDPVAISIFTDSAIPDEDPTPDAFSATGPGTFTYRFRDFTPGGGDVRGVLADASGGEWNGDLFVTDPGGLHPVTLALYGEGMTQDQILPDFASFTSGSAFFDASLTPFGGTVDVTFDAVAIVPVGGPGSSVPTVSGDLRITLAFLLLAFGLFWTSRSCGEVAGFGAPTSESERHRRS